MSLLALALVAVFVLGTASPASAHATVVSSDPADGQVLAVAPTKVEVRFSETVSVEVGGLTVLDSKGNRVDNGDVRRDDSNTVLSVGLERGLGADTYVINYRITSGDGHPVVGGILFGVGPGASVNDAAVTALKVKTDPTWEFAAAVARFITYTAALLAAGLACFLAFIHDQRRDRWKLAPVIRAAALVTAFGAIMTIITQAALVTGRGLPAARDMTVLRSILSDRLGWSSVILLVGLALLHLSTDTNNMIVAQLLTYNGGLMVTASFALWGHTTQGSSATFATITDAVHATAAAIWFGGLVGLAITIATRSKAHKLVRRQPDASGSVTADDVALSTVGILARFSTLAAVSLVAIAASGFVVARTQLPDSAAMLNTPYGRLVMVKILIVVGIVAIAAYNRFKLVPSIRDWAKADHPVDVGAEGAEDSTGSPEAAGAWKRLLTTTKIEACAIIVILVVTSILVGVSPSRTQPGSTAFNSTVTDDRGGKVSLSVTPGRAGPNTLHIQYFDSVDLPDASVTQVQVEFLNVDKGIGPIVRATDPAGSGHFTFQGTELSIAGKWKVTLIARLSEFSEQRTSFDVDVAG